jgi:hypothetical protein
MATGAAEIVHAPIGGLVDAVTVGIGFLIVGGKALARWYTSSPMTLGSAATDLLNGTVVTPFTLMVGAVFSNSILEYLRSTSPVSTAIAGGIGLFFAFSEIRKLV